MLNVAEACLGEEEKEALLKVIDSGWITMGDTVRRFEEEFAAVHGASEAVAVASCTAGLHLILHGLGLGPGDEVLVPAMTFVATANCVLYVGARPVFVDIQSLHVPLMSLEDAALKCTAKTRAIILVHYAGFIHDRERWQTFAAERGLLLIEDCAHAAGMKEAGTFGAAAAFSFYGNKNMTTAEGGAVIAHLPGLSDFIRKARGHGLTTGTFQRHGAVMKGYDVPVLGFNYRMDELRAALGIVQLQKLPRWNEKRRDLVLTYRRLMRCTNPDVAVPFSDMQVSSFHIMPVVLPRGASREDVSASMRAAGVQTSIHYPAAHQFTYYARHFPGVSLPVTEDYSARELTLPLHPNLKDSDVAHVTRALADALATQRVGTFS